MYEIGIRFAERSDATQKRNRSELPVDRTKPNQIKLEALSLGNSRSVYPFRLLPSLSLTDHRVAAVSEPPFSPLKYGFRMYVTRSERMTR